MYSYVYTNIVNMIFLKFEVKITLDAISEHQNFKIFLGWHVLRPPRSGCYAAELPLATMAYSFQTILITVLTFGLTITLMLGPALC